MHRGRGGVCAAAALGHSYDSVERGDAEHPHAVTEVSGNLTDVSVPGVPALTTGAGTYDTVGNLKSWKAGKGSKAYVYDDLGRVAKVTRTQGTDDTGDDITVESVYDAAGLRVGRKETTPTPGGGTEVASTLFLGDVEVTKTVETTPDGSTGTDTLATMRTITAGGVAVGQQTADDKFGWTMGDQQGNIRLSVGDTGPQWVDYRPYGDPINPDNGPGARGGLPGGRGYLGKTHDASGEVRLDHRSYDPTMSGLTTPDPLLRTYDPLNHNPYSYARNNPITGSDPSGLDPKNGSSQTGRDYQCTYYGHCGKKRDITNTTPAYVPDVTSSPTYIGPDLPDVLPVAEPPAPPPPQPNPSGLMGFLRKHSTAVGIVTGIVVGGACLGLTLGAGSVACGVAGGAAGSVATSYLDGDSAGETLKKAAFNGALGAVGGPAVKYGSEAFKGVLRYGDDAVESAAKVCSFAGATLVLMADGTRKRIQDVVVGDKIIATDPETGEQAAKTVEQVFVHEDTVIDLIVDGTVIATTEDHPFWSVTEQRFERADELAPGEGVLGADGSVITVSGLKVGTARQALAYNLSVQGIHTYHVGLAEILVHNTCSLAQRAEELAARAGRNRVSVETPTGRLSVDLQGKAHYEKSLGSSIDTPHTKFETRHVGPNGQISYTSGPVRPASWGDLRIIDRILLGRGN